MAGTNKSKLKPYSVELVFWYHQNFLNQDDLRFLNRIFKDENLAPAIQSTPGNFIIRPLEEILETNFINYEANGEIFGNKLKTIGFPIITQFNCSLDPWCSFTWSVFKGNLVEIGLTGSIFTTFEDRKDSHCEFAKIFQSFASKLYTATRPVSGHVLDPYIDSRRWNLPSKAKRKSLTLNWFNFFGSEIANEYGQDILKNIPSHQVENLDDGGILIQSRPTILIENRVAYERWQDEVTAYLTQHNIQADLAKL